MDLSYPLAIKTLISKIVSIFYFWGQKITPVRQKIKEKLERRGNYCLEF